MNKKLIFGSIIAVAILIGVSFTSVVGYQSTSRTIAEASPLFNIRTSRAIDEESKDYTRYYIGKGEKIDIPLPTRNNITFLIKRVFERLKRIDDDQLEQFRDFVKEHVKVSKLKNKKNLNETELPFQLRDNPLIIDFINNNSKVNNLHSSLSSGLSCPDVCTGNYYPNMCFVDYIFLLLYIITAPIWITLMIMFFILIFLAGIIGGIIDGIFCVPVGTL